MARDGPSPGASFSRVDRSTPVDSAAEGGMRAADVQLPAVHAKAPRPEVRLAGRFPCGAGPGTTLWTGPSGQVPGEGSGPDFARGAGYLDRLLVEARGTVESKITALSR